MQTSPIAKLLLAASLAVVGPGRAAEPTRKARPRVELVFVLDTTGSMGALLQGAKQKVWSIVNEIAKGQPTPDIRVGLIGFRDKGDAYVTTRTDLTQDLDALYEKLMALEAAGGGDGPEAVNQALHEAVERMAWSAERTALKMIFLVGDAPPHMDYKDDVKYPVTCQAAVQKDILIHTIQCGKHAQTTRFWQDIAQKAEGRAMVIAQSGGTLAVVTPYDGRLAELSAALDETYLGYGRAEERALGAKKMESARSVAAEAAPEAAASRASYKATTGALGGKDLLADIEHGVIRLEDVKPEELPAEMQKMSPSERRAHLARKKAQREKVQADIRALSVERDAYVKEQMRVAGRGGESFDAKVIEAVREKAQEKGIAY